MLAPMYVRKRTLLAAVALALSLGAATLAYAIPGATACSLVGIARLHPLADGTLVEAGTSEQDQHKLQDLIVAAKSRIENTFGAPRAKPTLIFFRDPRTFWWLKVNPYGSTNFVGSRACVIVGARGLSTDVLAHELMHAELADRVGYWRRFTEIPVWFDEGIAMQVDRRPRFALPPGAQVDTSYVRQLQSARSFFQANEQQLVRNYASAGAEVAHWLSDVGPQSLYPRLDRIAHGEQFDSVLRK